MKVLGVKVGLGIRHPDFGKQLGQPLWRLDLGNEVPEFRWYLGEAHWGIVNELLISDILVVRPGTVNELLIS
jgi:hypothetical protein